MLAAMTNRRSADRPGVLRLRAMDAKPRLPSARAVVAAVVAPPVVSQPQKRHKTVPAEQAALL